MMCSNVLHCMTMIKKCTETQWKHLSGKEKRKDDRGRKERDMLIIQKEFRRRGLLSPLSVIMGCDTA